MMSTTDPAAEQRCAFTDLYPSQCDHCRHPVRRPQFREPGGGAVDESDWDDQIVAAFTAEWNGLCGWCGEDFLAGAWISKTRNNKYVCTECLE